jgi:GT2 family glycosyltransferase
MLNPDVTLKAEDIFTLVGYLQEYPRSIVAPLVVEQGREDRIAWAGSCFEKLPGLPIYTSRYIAKRGQPVSTLGTDPYRVDEVHGRGVVLSRQVYDEIGMFDADVFPQYGADNDYSWRAVQHGIELMVLPSVRVSLDVENTGQSAIDDHSLGERAHQIYNYLTDQKHGDALRVWWMLMKRHVPPHAVVPSFAFNVGLNVARRLR